jgi:hypothetical protein
MKFTKPALSLMALLGAIYMTPVAFAGATNSGNNTSATPGDNSSTTRTPSNNGVAPGVDSSTTTTPSGNVVPDPGTPATRAGDTPSSGTGATAHDRSDTTKTNEMKSKSMRSCDTNRDPNCDKNKNMR